MQIGTVMPEVDTPSMVCPLSILVSLKADFLLYFPDYEREIGLDIAYLSARYRSEGIIFLTVTLSSLGKAIDAGLISGEFSPPLGWSLRKGTKLPRVLNFLFKKVFEDTGCLLPRGEVSVAACKLLRQITLFWSKLESNSLEEEGNAFLASFFERITRSRQLPATLNPVADILSKARALLSELFDARSPLCHDLTRFRKNPWGRHGPGAVANREKAGEKWNFICYPSTPLKLFEWREGLQKFPRDNTIPSSRVTLVPKDFRGPRVISIEPKEYQFAQQGLMELLYTLISKHSLTRKAINFFDVSGSRKLCFNYNYATIDLKDASDNLSLELVKLLLPRWLYRTIVRYRTPYVSGQRSSCFATMGSALCFPIQTVVFWALAQATIVCRQPRGRQHKTSRVTVFGDDIIVPNSLALNVVRTLSACGLVINHSKTCISSRVRESCGEWVFDGVSVRVLRLRNHRISSIVDWGRLVDYAEESEELSMPSLSRLFRSLAFWLYLPRERWGTRYQRQELRIPVLIGRRTQQVAGYAGLYAWHTRSAINPSSKGDVRSKWKWVGAHSKIAP